MLFTQILNNTYLYHLDCISNLHKARIYHHLHASKALAIGGCLRYVYLAFASDQGCEDVNQLYVSFELADRYLILEGTKCYKAL